MASLRAQDHYKAVTRELRAAGLTWREEMGGKHARLLISVNGREEVEVLSISPSDRKAPIRAASQIRRRIREWKAEATSSGATQIAPAVFPTLEERTMDDSTTSMSSAIELIAPTEGIIGETVVQTVSARDLHAFLGVKSAFKDWVARRIAEYAFEDGTDFCSFLSESSGGRPSKEYAISIDMAKELAMVERTPKGKEARRYFIECERRLANIAPEAIPRIEGGLHDEIENLHLDVLETKESSGEVVARIGDLVAIADRMPDKVSGPIFGYIQKHILSGIRAVHDDIAALARRQDQLYAYVEEMRRSSYARDMRVIKSLPASIDPLAFNRDHYCDVDDIYVRAKAHDVVPRRAQLSRLVQISIDQFFKAARSNTGHQRYDARVITIRGKRVNLWESDGVDAWLANRGLAMIQAHVGRHGDRGQMALHLVEGGRP